MVRSEFAVGFLGDGSIGPVLAQDDGLAGRIRVLVLLALLVTQLPFGGWSLARCLGPESIPRGG